jgi:uracil-DNA glycosylase family protein
MPTRTSAPGAQEFLPAEPDSLAALRTAAESCRGCALHGPATQTVFGAGPATARLVLLGEQPGDQEDRAGEPFVGPAGALLDGVLTEAGIDRSTVYVTNAVKHFKFTPAERSNRRIHKTPVRGEVRACFPWLAAEIRVVAPELVVCLGATAAQALLGPAFRLTQHRGELITPPESVLPDDGARGWSVLATIHPAAVLRSPEPAEARAGLLADLRIAAETLRG